MSTGTPTRPVAPRPAQRGSRSSFTGRALVLALVATALLVSMAVPVRAWLAQRAQIADLRAQVDEAAARVEALAVEKKRWDDPSFVAAQARDRLHFVLPGEVGYVAVGAQEQAGATAEAAVAGQPWYANLWDGLQQADDHAILPAGTATP
ncbi:MAG: septum formation initiator family protein [Candidatus Nanopelagicales bacterium]